MYLHLLYYIDTDENQDVLVGVYDSLDKVETAKTETIDSLSRQSWVLNVAQRLYDEMPNNVVSLLTAHHIAVPSRDNEEEWATWMEKGEDIVSDIQMENGRLKHDAVALAKKQCTGDVPSYQVMDYLEFKIQAVEINQSVLT